MGWLLKDRVITRPFRAQTQLSPGNPIATTNAPTQSGRLGAHQATLAQTHFTERLGHYQALLRTKLPAGADQDRAVQLLSNWTGGDLAYQFSDDVKPNRAFRKALENAFQKNLKAVLQIEGRAHNIDSGEQTAPVLHSIQSKQVLQVLDEHIVDNDLPLTALDAEKLITTIKNADKSIWDKKTKAAAEQAISAVIECFKNDLPTQIHVEEPHPKAEAAWRKAQSKLQTFGDELLPLTPNPDPQDLLAHTRGMVANGDLARGIDAMRTHFSHGASNASQEMESIVVALANSNREKNRVALVANPHEEGVKFTALGGTALLVGGLTPGVAAIIAGTSIAGGVAAATVLGASTFGIGLAIAGGIVGVFAGSYALYRLGKYIHGKVQLSRLRKAASGDVQSLENYRKKHKLKTETPLERIQFIANNDLISKSPRLAAQALLQKLRTERASLESEEILFTPAVKLLLTVYEPDELLELMDLNEKEALDSLGEHFNTYL
jgi:hypothetical protein